MVNKISSGIMKLINGFKINWNRYGYTEEHMDWKQESDDGLSKNGGQIIWKELWMVEYLYENLTDR